MYQRHLQQQYVHSMKRNQQLEEALGMLGITGVPQSSPGSSSSDHPSSILGNTLKKPLAASPKSNCSDPIAIDLDVSSNSSNGESQC